MAIEGNGRSYTDAEVQVDLCGPVQGTQEGLQSQWAQEGLPAQPPPSTQPPGDARSAAVRRWFLPLSIGALMVAVSVGSSASSSSSSTTGFFWEGFAFQLARRYLEGLGLRGGGGGGPPGVGRESGTQRGEGGAHSFYFPLEDLGADGRVLFMKHDVNADGMLSMEEFAPLSRRLLSFNDTIKYERNLTADEEIVTVEVKFQPLKIETMTKDFTVKSSGADSLHGLKQWKTPAKLWENFGARDFQPFLPKESASARVGDVYWVVEGSAERGPSLSSDRYMPPALDGEAEIVVHRLLSLFHPLPFVHMRFSPKGSTAVVRAQNDAFLDIAFRIHAEFQLNLPPYFPFWFTPAQFKGHVTIARDSSHLVSFQMHVPTDKRLNVDMEWLNGNSESGNMEVDIGFMPQMELSSTAESILAVTDEGDRRAEYIAASDRQEIVWNEEISTEEAERLLEQEMYPFKKVVYHNFTDGLSEAARLDRPIHAIALWGCLDDQSC